MNPAPFTEMSPPPFSYDPISILPATSRIVRPRTLFRNDFVSMVSVTLKSGQRLDFAKPVLRLLTLVHGCVKMRGPNGSFVMQGAGSWRLEPGEQWKIRALADTNLLFFLRILPPEFAVQP